MTKSHAKNYVGCEVPTPFYEDFKAMAKSNNRTLAGEIRIALEAHYTKFKAKIKVQTKIIQD